MKKEDIKIVLDRLEASYPDAECALDHRNVFELIVAVSLSAQTTDVSVNKVTPALFAKYPDAESLAKADIKDLEDMLRTIGMYRNKAKNVKALGLALAENYGGEVPHDYNELVKLPGVGRKTANVVLSVGFGEQRIAVDTHVFRVSNRIGLVNEKDVLKTELKLMERIPKERWSKTHHSLIFHGRNCCSAKKPKCKECPILELCQYKDKEI
ncbi:MAG: endonuclease III [Clostridia bacterium]|nr:endonuclease III [Clostridia bacterium]